MRTPGERTARRAVTLRDVAAAARVHVATASRALDAETAHPVSQKTRARVQRVAEELGYRHHMMARGCAVGSARPSAWWSPTSATPTPRRSCAGSRTVWSGPTTWPW